MFIQHKPLLFLLIQKLQIMSIVIKLSYYWLRSVKIITESLILAQNERWRHVLSMQVER